ncbi:DNA-binding response regulator [Clostridium sp.]|uniref:helix-turn-helix domain-containing protein n=1 Tax=Clostridium sp. TaxID=1506 RepID=UPI002A90A8F6|nr:DNA-binding response regulator [Clostridium sp.]MDY6013160.1 DNA-binding response regulator [Clostridium sp.]
MGQALELNNLTYLERVHGNSNGWITKSVISADAYSQYHYKYLELKDMDMTGDNIYISLNTFYKPCRRIETVKELNALYIDLDCYNTEFTKEQIIMNLEENYFNKSIPIPNFVIDSGRGLYLIFLINKLPYKALPLWKAVEEYLYKQLKQFGADKMALDATRVLRVPNTINSKSNTKVTILDEYYYIYDLREIQKEFLPLLEPTKKKKGRPNKINFIYRERSLYHARIQDIIKLCELRNYNLKGYREIILFLYRYWLCSFTDDTEKALDDTLELNKEFAHPLSKTEATRATRSAEKCYKDKKREYKYKNETLIELLDITEEEQQHMLTIISKDEYKRRDREYQKKKYQDKLKKDGKLTKKEEVELRRQKIKDLIAQGLTQKEIYTLLNISKRTCINDFKYLKEQGLL